MITNEGKLHIKRYLAGIVPNIGQQIGFGLGSTAEVIGSTDLQFEVDRSNILVVSYDFENDRLIFKAEVPETYAGKIYEVALFYGVPPYNTKMLTTFDSPTEVWVTDSGAPVFNSTNTRIGIDSLRLTPALSTTSTSIVSSMNFDLSENSSSDKFLLAFNNGNTNAQTVAVRLKTDASNYYTLTVTNPASGYIISEILKSAATVTGTPSWANITSIDVLVTSKSSGASQVDFDGFRIQDQSTIRQNYTLVSREVLPSPFTKVEGMVQEIEFTLDVTV